MTLPELAIRRHVTTLMILVSLAVLGTVAVTRLPLAHLPDMEEPELFARFPYPNASPEQIERMIIRPAEDALGSVKGLRRMWSRCWTDGGNIRLEFDWGTDLHLARVEMWEKLDRIRRDLPEDIEDITIGTHWRGDEADDPILEVRVSSELDLSESYDLLERRIVRPLQRVPGVAQVRIDGVNPKEVRINLRIADLELHRIDVREVSRILRSSNFDQSLGKITDGEVRLALRTIGSFKTIDEVGNLVLRADGLRLRDVADVVYEEPPLEFGRHLDGNFAVGLTVSAEAGANVVEVCDRLKERLEKMNEDPELKGVSFMAWFDQGLEIRRTLAELFFTGVFGAVLASAVLYLFLRRLSTTLVSVLCIPLALIATCGFIWAQGSTLNTLTLLGLIVGIGMLVDNAVVVIENIFRHQERGDDQKTAARLGSREVSVAVIAATLTSVIVFLPLVFNKPSELSIPLKEIGFTVCLTLLASLFISQTLIPLATSWFIRARQRPRERWLVWLEDRYRRLLEFNLRHRWLTPLIGIAVTASAVFPFLRTDINFDNRDAPLYVQVRYDFSEEVPLEKKEEVVTQVEKLLEPHRDRLMARSIYSYWRDGFAMTRIYLGEGEATQENLETVRQRLREVLPDVAGIRWDLSEHHRSWHRNRGKMIAFQLVGDDSEVLGELAEEARRRLEQIPGLKNFFSGYRDVHEELHVELDRDLLARYGITAGQVSETVGLTFRGRRLQRFRTPDGEREMRLTLDEREKETLAQLYNLPAWTADRERVPLASVADFNDRRGPRRVERDERMTSVWVGARYTTGTREDYVPLVTAAMSTMYFPPGYSWTFGDWQDRKREMSLEFLVNLGLALLLIFAVMSGLFESVQQAIALMIALPFALAGALWTLWAVGADFDQPAAVGVLLLIGIVVNNGIVMIEHINQYRRSGMPRHDAMILGCRERLRPILMTAMTTLLGLVPIVIKQPSLGGMAYYTMALVIMGGITVSTFLTSVLLPTTVTLVEDGVAWCGRMLRVKG